MTTTLETAYATFQDAMTAKPGARYVVQCAHGWVPCHNYETATTVLATNDGITIHATSNA